MRRGGAARTAQPRAACRTVARVTTLAPIVRESRIFLRRFPAGWLHVLAPGALLAVLLRLAPCDASTLEVPGQYPTVQAAIDAAAGGDEIALAPGVYPEAITISGKTLAIRSRFATSGDPADVEATVLEAVGADVVTALSGAQVLLHGVTLQKGLAAVRLHAGTRLELLDSRVLQTVDGISLEGGSSAGAPLTTAIVRRCRIEGNGDDGIDSDGKSQIHVEDSEILGNGDDGIEIRLHANGFAAGQAITHVLLGNRITSNGEDGLQLIDYPGLSPRSFRIERNVFAGNAMAGIGMMCDGNTIEDFQGCPIPEPVRLLNNSFVGNDHGLSGGADAVGVNNLFAGNATLGAKNVAGGSALVASLFHDNGTDYASSQVDPGSTLLADPRLDAEYRLQDGSPAIDAGLAYYQHGAETVIDLAPDEYAGSAPDLGAFEWAPGTAGPLEATVRVAASADDAEEGPTYVALTSSDLELVTDGPDVQTVGIRFRDLPMPRYAPILAAWIQFQADETNAGATGLSIQAEAADDALPFAAVPGNLAARPRSAAWADWTPPPWTVAGAAGEAERTPDLAALVQEIVDRPGWEGGNALAFLVAGAGRRTAVSYDGSAGSAPLLRVQYALPGCGNGFLEPGEACDDGNVTPGDGCDGSCQLSAACADGVDNDVDSRFDFPGDPGCAGPDDDSERSSLLPCDNGIDDDGDGGIDFAGDDDEDGIPDPPGDLGCAGPASPGEAPACQDGVDNDGQPGIDFDGGASVHGAAIAPIDPECAGRPYLDREAASACGIGAERVALWGLAAVLRPRRRKAASQATSSR